MMYQYTCTNPECECFETEIMISKSMNEYSREEKCEKCDSVLQRVYTSFGLQTFGDGYKA